MEQRSVSAEGPALLVHQVRLFRNAPGVQWEHRVHEQILPSLRRAAYAVRWTDISITHAGYQDASGHAGKNERNLRLLRLDQIDHPDDPFTLFNLGLAYSKVGSTSEVLPLLQRCLERFQPGDSLVPKAYAALVRVYDNLGKPEEAVAACRAGRGHCPEDPELLFLDGFLRHSRNDLTGAESCWRQLLALGAGRAPVALSPAIHHASWQDQAAFWHGLPTMSPTMGQGQENLPQRRTGGLQSQSVWGLGMPARSTSALDPPWGLANVQDESGQGLPEPIREAADVDEALFAWARHYLALLYRKEGRLVDAEAQWVEALNEHPGFLVAWIGLGDLYLAQEHWADLERAVEALKRVPRAIADALLLRAQQMLARKDFATARQLAEEAIARDPKCPKAKVLLTHVLLAQDSPAAEKALHDVLAIDPDHAQSWGNLVVFLRRQGRLAQALTVCESARVHCSNDPDLLLFQGTLSRELGDWARADSCLRRLLEEESANGNGRARTARHHLALTHRDQGRFSGAISHWRVLLEDNPDHVEAIVGLGEVYLAQGYSSGWQEMVQRLSDQPEWVLEAKVLSARGELARQDFVTARQLLEEVLHQRPDAERPLILLSHVLLQEGRDWLAAERALRRILQVNPDNAEARNNLEVLLRRQRSQG